MIYFLNIHTIQIIKVIRYEMLVLFIVFFINYFVQINKNYLFTLQKIRLKFKASYF